MYEIINRVAGVLGQSFGSDGFERPVIGRVDRFVAGAFGRPGQALTDPLGEGGNGGPGKFLAFLRHGGDVLIVDLLEGANDEAFSWILKVDDGAVVAALEPPIAVIELETDLGLGAGVAVEAIFSQHGTNLFFEELNLRRGEIRGRLVRHGIAAERRCHQRKPGAGEPDCFGRKESHPVWNMGSLWRWRKRRSCGCPAAP